MKSGEERSLRVSKSVDPKAGEKPRGEVGFTHKSLYSGPIPTPQMFADFEKVLPGSANRILTMAEDQSKHRQRIETRVIWFDGGQSILGLLLAFLVVIAGLGFGAYLIMNDKAVSGLATILLALGSVIGSMVVRQSAKKPDEKKDEKK